MFSVLPTEHLEDKLIFNPANEDEFKWETLSTSYLNDNDFFFGETLTFNLLHPIEAGASINSIPGQNPIMKSLLQVTEYWNLYYQRTSKTKVIAQPFNASDGQTPTHFAESQALNAKLIAYIESGELKGWKNGPEFTYNLDYIRTQIRDFWGL
jgi:hypothetical protein